MNVDFSISIVGGVVAVVGIFGIGLWMAIRRRRRFNPSTEETAHWDREGGTWEDVDLRH